MNRKKLISTLELVKPALADDGLVPIFTNYCFDNGKVFGYKDSLGIVAPCEVKDSFALQGRLLFDLLKQASAKEVEFEQNNDEVVVQSGRTKMTLPSIPKDEFIFEEPEDQKWDFMIDVDDNLITAMTLCLKTSSTDFTMPAFNGLTFKGGKGTKIYSCDGDSLSRYSLGGNSPEGVTHTISNEFCEAVIKVCEKTGYKNGQLYINDEWSVAELGNDYKIYGRIIQNDEPLDFEKQIKRVVKGAPDYVDIPDGLKAALSRARVVADLEGTPTALNVAGGKVKLATNTHMGAVTDRVKISGKHPDVKANVSARLVSRALSICDSMAIGEEATSYKLGDKFFLLVANFNE